MGKTIRKLHPRVGDESQLLVPLYKFAEKRNMTDIKTLRQKALRSDRQTARISAMRDEEHISRPRHAALVKAQL